VPVVQLQPPQATFKVVKVEIHLYHLVAQLLQLVVVEVEIIIHPMVQ
jgi:hypothetical protein